MKPINFELLAKWNYTPKEWDEYVTLEKGNKKEDNIYFGIGILILGSIGLMLLRQTSFLGGLVFALPLAILIPWLRMKFSYPYLKKGIKNPVVEIYKSYLLINSKKVQLFDTHKRVKSIKIINVDDKTNLLEFDVQWLTRKGPTNDEFRILIPKDKLSEAKNLIPLF